MLSKSSEGLMLSAIKEIPQKKECASFFNESFLDPALTSHLWLLEKLPSLPQFDVIKISLCLSLRQVIFLFITITVVNMLPIPLDYCCVSLFGHD